VTILYLGFWAARGNRSATEWAAAVRIEWTNVGVLRLVMAAAFVLQSAQAGVQKTNRR